jgi:hypothetical protein
MLEWKRTRMKPIPPPVALCDLDNKPTPRSKEPRKRVKAATKSKEATDTVVNSSVDVVEEQQEDEEDAEGYETATEEFADSHQLEEGPCERLTTAPIDEVDKTSVAQSTTTNDVERMEEGGVSPHKRVGRVSLSWTNGTDPGYPKLPKTSQEEDTSPLSTISSQDEVGVQPKNQDDGVSHQRQNDTDDEYADPELEDALRRMTLDDSGRLTEDVTDPASERTISPPTTRHHNLGVQSVQHVETATARDASDARVVDISDFNPTSLDFHESDELARVPAPQADIGLLEEPSRTPEYNLATTWAQEHLQLTIPSLTSTTPSRIRATVTHLRAYHMWHYQKLPVEKMAHILRDPPLSRDTVANYILQAVTLERLGYEGASLRNVLLALPSGIRKGRWKALAEEVGVLD